MFKAIIDWFMVNYEAYLLIGIGFALLEIYSNLRALHETNRFSRHKYKLNAWGYMSPIVAILFYPVFIIVWLLNKLAQWD